MQLSSDSLYRKCDIIYLDGPTHQCAGRSHTDRIARKQSRYTVITIDKHPSVTQALIDDVNLFGLKRNHLPNLVFILFITDRIQNIEHTDTCNTLQRTEDTTGPQVDVLSVQHHGETTGHSLKNTSYHLLDISSDITLP